MALEFEELTLDKSKSTDVPLPTEIADALPDCILELRIDVPPDPPVVILV